jgi:Flp pilus assembly protein TadD
MTLARLARACSLVAILVTPLAALADDYADVNQLAKQGKWDQALAKADQYLTAKPRDPQMRFLKGVIQAEAGKRADAIATYTQLTQEYPELPEPYNNLAVLYAQQNEYDKAREALEGAVRANPGYATAHENLGDVYAKLASQSYAKAQQIEPANASAASKLALVRQLLSAPQKR